jgi:hypothetical protein
MEYIITSRNNQADVITNEARMMHTIDDETTMGT